MKKKTKFEKTLTYNSYSPLKSPLSMLKNMWNDLTSSFDLAWRLSSRDIAAQYRQTYLGYLWAVLPPVMTSLTFILLSQAQVTQIGQIGVPYPLYVFSGTIFWQLFVDSLNSPLRSISINRSLLTKINFPREALIISSVCQTLFSFSIKIALLILLFFIYRVSFSVISFLVIIPIIGIMLVGILSGMLLIPLGMLYQDIEKGLIVVTSSLIFFTPVLFPIPTDGLMSRIIFLNPLTPFFILMRESFFSASTQYLYSCIAIIFASLLILVVAWVLYRLAMPFLIERMEA